jgi:hypothetical protein
MCKPCCGPRNHTGPTAEPSQTTRCRKKVKYIARGHWEILNRQPQRGGEGGLSSQTVTALPGGQLEQYQRQKDRPTTATCPPIHVNQSSPNFPEYTPSCGKSPDGDAQVGSRCVHRGTHPTGWGSGAMCKRGCVHIAGGIEKSKLVTSLMMGKKGPAARIRFSFGLNYCIQLPH